jgi:uncharacterized membrane protein (DUF485 family)
MRRGVFFFLAIAFAALALWSAWNPGYYYLGRATVLTLIGAGASYAWIRDRNRRYALAASLLYVTLVVGIAFAEEEITAPASQTESINVWYVLLAALFLIATAIAAVIAKFRHHT